MQTLSLNNLEAMQVFKVWILENAINIPTPYEELSAEIEKRDHV